jgi:hypothetical protein
MAEAMTRKAFEGVRELDQEKLTRLLRMKCHDSIPDAVDDLGQPEEIRAAFAGFQKYLYQPAASLEIQTKVRGVARVLREGAGLQSEHENSRGLEEWDSLRI